MSINETPGSTTAAGAAGAEYAWAVLHMARRYAAGIPAGQRNEVDKAVWAALDRIPDASQTVAKMVRRVDGLAETRKKELFGSTYAFQPAGTALGRTDLEAIINGLGGTERPADTKPVKHKFELEFDHLVLVDESNPEWAGKDEPYTVFAITTQADADAGKEARAVRTPVYSLNEGERGPASGSQNLRLFGPTGPAQINSDVLMMITAMEHDNSDLQDVVGTIATALTVAAAVATAAGKKLLAAALGIASSVAGLIAAGLADDQVGNTLPFGLTNAEAEAKTASDAKVTLPALRFDGGDANGVHQVFLTLSRV
jgi:hypothetical protein